MVDLRDGRRVGGRDLVVSLPHDRVLLLHGLVVPQQGAVHDAQRLGAAALAVQNFLKGENEKSFKHSLIR